MPEALAWLAPLGWASPLVLLLLLPIPLLRWLHRRREAEAEIRVSALFLWPESRSDQGAEHRVWQPDPRWRLRALVCGLLVVVAAGLQLLRPVPTRVDLYLDDSPSLLAREVGGSRLDLALGELAEALEEREVAELRVLSLRRRGRSLALDAADPQRSIPAIHGWLRTELVGEREGRLPAAAELRRDRESWLLSDGADSTVAAWAVELPLQRVIAVGSETENSAVTHLSVRPLLRQPGRLSGMVRVANAGKEADSRRLEIRDAEGILFQELIELAPGERVQRSFELSNRPGGPDGPEGPDTPVGRLRARLAPGDALPEDDELTLELSALEPLRVRLDPSCGRHLRSAVLSHPALLPAGDDRPGLGVWCSASPPAAPHPMLWFRPGGSRLEPGPGGPGSAGWIEVALDPEDPELSAKPEFLSALSQLLDQAAGRELLDRVSGAGRSEASVAIAPREFRPDHGPAAIAAGEARLDISAPLLLLAVMLLLLDAKRTRAPR